MGEERPRTLPTRALRPCPHLHPSRAAPHTEHRSIVSRKRERDPQDGAEGDASLSQLQPEGRGTAQWAGLGSGVPQT